MSNPEEMKRGWSEFEEYAAAMLGLRRTISSGSKFYDPGDAVSHSHDNFPLFIDCKYTEKGSYTLKRRDLWQLKFRAEEMGKRLCMPIRIWPSNDDLAGPGDFVVLGFADFVELMAYTQGKI